MYRNYPAPTILMLSVMLFLFACTDCFETRTESYSTYDEADKAGFIKAAWMFPFLPQSSQDINARVNFQDGTARVSFRFAPEDLDTRLCPRRAMSRAFRRRRQRDARARCGGCAPRGPSEARSDGRLSTWLESRPRTERSRWPDRPERQHPERWSTQTAARPPALRAGPPETASGSGLP